MASIEGLSEEQCESLSGISVGDLILVQKIPHYGSEEDDDYDEERSDDGEEGENEEGDHEQSIGEGNGDEGQEKDQEDNQEDSSSESQNANSDDAGEDSAVQSDGTVATETEAEIALPPRMFVVSKLTKDESGSITDVKLSLLAYSDKVKPDLQHSYHVYGKECVHYHPSTCGGDKECGAEVSIQEVARDDSICFMAKPSGDNVRRIHSSIWSGNQNRSICVSGCSQGWLDTASTLQDMVKDYDVPTLTFATATGDPLPASLQPSVCPVCIGVQHLKDQQTLQVTLLQTGFVDIIEVIEFLARLNPRRRELGYRFRQFDEREWGQRFDDLDSEEGDEGDEDRFERWDEAQDPNSSARTRPASAHTIASLPRKTYKDVSATLDVDDCQICRVEFEPDTKLIELPCGHQVFDETCLETWLKQYDNCPMCRKKVPAIAPPPPPAANSEGEQGMFEMDGEDMVMSDV